MFYTKGTIRKLRLTLGSYENVTCGVVLRYGWSQSRVKICVALGVA